MKELFSSDLLRPEARKPSRYYLAYGSNLWPNRIKARCPDAVIAGSTVFRGYRLLFKHSKSGSYATLEQDANSSVPCGVYKISEHDEALLDRYEGYPKYYYKKYFKLPLMKQNGQWSKKVVCMVYIMHENRLLGEPSMEYFSLLDDGCRAWEFPADHLENGLRASIGDEAARKYLEKYEAGLW